MCVPADEAEDWRGDVEGGSVTVDLVYCIDGYAHSRVIHRIHSVIIVHINPSSYTAWLGAVHGFGPQNPPFL